MGRGLTLLSVVLLVGLVTQPAHAQQGAAMAGGVVTYQMAGKQYVAATSGATTYFGRTQLVPARVTIFSLPTADRP